MTSKIPFNLKLFIITLTSLTILEVISYFGYLAEPINHISFWLIIIAALILSCQKLEYGVWMVFAELVTGSKGYLFSFPIGHFTLSIRLGLFLVVIMAWVFHQIKQGRLCSWKSNFTKPYILLLVALIYAVVVGLVNHHPIMNVFLDANGYLFFGLFLIILQTIDSRKKIWNVLTIMTAGVVISCTKTIFLLFAFSHQLLPFISTIYRWVRFTGVGEITQLSNGFYRIFFQSHIYEVFAYFFLLVALGVWWKKLGRQWFPLYLRWLIIGATIIISLSRSLWIGLIVGMGVLVVVFYKTLQWSWKKILVSSVLVGASTFLQLGILEVVVNIPLPNTNGVSISSLVQDRASDATQEAAGASRFALIKPLFNAIAVHPVWGQGFGTTVSYASKDPRVIQATKGGLYTTFSFEWGYLDLWLKLGLVGFTVYLYFLWSIAREGKLAWKKSIQTTQGQFLLISSAISGVVLLTVHATTPYLNHPLGIGWLMLTAALFQVLRTETTPV